ncbi:RimK/LysX family protein [Vibrio sp.]|uniref:ATP-dependent zinc protease family protein n=1 Tax=Vibrio sp. TaxID=678 RepID=UPI003D13CD09
MNTIWRALVVMVVSGGMFACSTTAPSTETVEQTAQPETPVEQTQPEPVTEPRPLPSPDQLPDIVETDTAGQTKTTEPVVEPPAKVVEPEPVEVKKPPVAKVERKTADGKLILGSEEWVYFPGLERSVQARIDTGATTSSISAINVTPFERDGKDWVKFKLEHEGLTSKEVALPIERWVSVRQSNSEETEQRPVVIAWVQVGDVKDKTEFSLTDRTHLEFPVLLGRSFFKDIAIVDVGKKYVQAKHK